MIHVHGGSALLETIRRAEIPGDRLEWSEVLCQGPTPEGLKPADWYALRAGFLATAYGPPEAEVRASLATQDAALERAGDQDEIVLWFGPELFCQAILVRLLAHFADHPPPKARLSLISTDHYPGVDDRRSCTVSMLSGDQLRELFARRRPVTPAQLELGRRAWRAMTAPTPERLVALLRSDTGALPYLAAATRRLLAELPDARSGLGRTDAFILTALAARGPCTIGDLFVPANEPEPRRWLTDTILIDHVHALTTEPPLIEPAGTMNGLSSPVRPLAVANDVLAGRVDAIALRGIDRWVGGTHLTTRNVWRWDSAREAVTRD